MILERYPLFKKIEQRPGAWTGEVSLQSIDTFVSGYHYALVENGLTTHSEEPFFDWVANKLGYSESTAGWVNMILAHTIGLMPKDIDWGKFLKMPITKEQHQKSVTFFYELLEEYKNENPEERKRL